MTFISGSLWWFFNAFFECFFFWCVHLQHLTCTTFYQTGATYYLPALKLAAFFEPSKMDGWKLEYWYYVYIYIFIYSLGHFGLFSGVNSLAVSGRNRRWRDLQEYSFLSPGGYRLVPWGPTSGFWGKLISPSWVVVSNIFYFYPYFGKIPILTNIFQMGWNHQPASFRPHFQGPLPATNSLKPLKIPMVVKRIRLFPFWDSLVIYKPFWFLRDVVVSPNIWFKMEESQKTYISCIRIRLM